MTFRINLSGLFVLPGPAILREEIQTNHKIKSYPRQQRLQESKIRPFGNRGGHVHEEAARSDTSAGEIQAARCILCGTYLLKLQCGCQTDWCERDDERLLQRNPEGSPDGQENSERRRMCAMQGG